MIKTESLTINGRAFTRTYSDENRYVVRDGISYEEAVDPADKNRTYTEGAIIGKEQYDTSTLNDDDELTDEQAVAVILGGAL